MGYDLVIRNGTVVDGSGVAPYRADVGRRGRPYRRRRDGIRKGRSRRSTPKATPSPRASSTGTPTWTPRCSGIRSAPAPAGTGSPPWSWATAGSPSPRPGPTPRAGRPQPRTGRGHLRRRHGRPGSTGPGRPLPSTSTPWTAAQGHQLRRQRRPLGPAHLGHGRAGLRPGGHRGRPGLHGERAAGRRLAAGAIGLHDLSRSANHETSDDRPVASRLASVGRGATPGRDPRPGGAGRLRARPRAGRPVGRRRSPGRVPRAPHGPGPGEQVFPSPSGCWPTPTTCCSPDRA